MKRKDSDMTSGIIWKQLLSFGVPMMIGLLFQQLYNTVDTVVVGRFVGKEALAAVGSTGSIVNMLVGLCAGLSTGATVIIARYFGAHDYQKVRDAVHTTILLTFILCLVITPVGMLIVNPMLKLMATPIDVFSKAQEYLQIYFAGVSGLLIYNMGSGILRAVGDSRRPLYFLIFSAAVNVVFDLLFVIKFGLGIAGVAYATIMSEFLSAVLVLITLTISDGPYGIRWKHLKIDKPLLKDILRIGLPSGLQQAITSFSNVFVQSYINAFGSSCMAGWSCYNKLDVFIMIPMQSISMASTTFVSQNHGSGNLKRARDGVRQSIYMSLAVTILSTVAVLLARRPLIELFSPEEDVITYGELFICYISPFYIIMAAYQILAGALRGVGDAKTPTIIMLCSFVVFRQIYLYVNKLLGGAFVPVALAYPVGWVLCTVLLAIFYKKSVLCTEDKEDKTPITA